MRSLEMHTCKVMSILVSSILITVACAVSTLAGQEPGSGGNAANSAGGGACSTVSMADRTQGSPGEQGKPKESARSMRKEDVLRAKCEFFILYNEEFAQRVEQSCLENCETGAFRSSHCLRLRNAAKECAWIGRHMMNLLDWYYSANDCDTVNRDMITDRIEQYYYRLIGVEMEVERVYAECSTCNRVLFATASEEIFKRINSFIGDLFEFFRE